MHHTQVKTAGIAAVVLAEYSEKIFKKLSQTKKLFNSAHKKMSKKMC